MNTLAIYSAVAIGGALGACSRYGLSGYITAALGTAFPWATLIVNVFGGALIGLFYVLLQQQGVWPSLSKPIIITGFLGGLTTFSTFSLEALQLLQSGQFVYAVLYMMASVVLCVAACYLMVVITQGLIGT